MQGRIASALLICIFAIAGCGDDGEGGGGAQPTPTPAPNQFGFADDVLRAGAASLSIAPLPAGSGLAAALTGVPTFETFTDFNFTLRCADDPAVLLHFEGNALFDGVLTRPQGAEPWLDCGGEAGRFDFGVDVFADVNGNGTFEGDITNPEGLEPFHDADGDGQFDAIWMGGFDSGRAAQGIDLSAPPMVTALVLSKGREFVVLVTLDTIGNVSTHLNPLRQRVAAEIGLDGSRYDHPDVQRIIVSSLHNHETADTIGVAGPTALSSEVVRQFLGGSQNAGLLASVPVRTGIHFEYRQWLDDQVVEAVREAVRQLRPAELRVAAAPAPMRDDAEVLNPQPADQSESFLVPRADHLLMTDIRWPFVTDPLVLSFQIRDVATGTVIATLASWSNHVEVLGSRNNLLSADYAGYVREHLEKRFGGVGIAVVGAVGGLQTPLQNVFVPTLDEEANVLRTDGSRVSFAEMYEPVLDGQRSANDLALSLFTTARRAAEESTEKTQSLGRIVAEVAALSLERARFAVPEQFAVNAASVLIPLENPTLYLASVLGVVEGRDVLFKGQPRDSFVADRPDRCGPVGCLRETITIVDFGHFQWVTAPGELLPEYVVGRPRPGVPQDEGIRFVKKDVDGSVLHDFGVNEFATIHALRHDRPNLFVFGLAQGQLGYFIPQSDFVNVFEGTLPPPGDITSLLGVLADLDIVPLLDLYQNPGFTPDESLTIRQIIETGWTKFSPELYPPVLLGGVSLADVPGVSLAADHPNVIGNNNSLGPRVGHIVYNAICDLLDDRTSNASCATKLPVENDPNE